MKRVRIFSGVLSSVLFCWSLPGFSQVEVLEGGGAGQVTVEPLPHGAVPARLQQQPAPAPSQPAPAPSQPAPAPSQPAPSAQQTASPSPEAGQKGTAPPPEGATPAAAAESATAPPEQAPEQSAAGQAQSPPVAEKPGAAKPGTETPAAEKPAAEKPPSSSSAVGDKPTAASSEPAAASKEGAGKPKFKKYQFGIMLDATLGLGNTADFVSQPSIQGFSIDARYFITEKIGVGLSAAFDTLSQRRDDTVTWQNITMTGEHTEQVSFTPLLAKGVYTFRKNPKYTPYLALGLGAARHARQLFAGFSTMRAAAWHFAVAPELGVTVGIGKATLIGCLRLNYLTSSKDIPSQLFANLSLGVAIQ